MAARPLADFGLRRPNEHALPLIGAAALPCVVLGFWLAGRVPQPWASLLIECLELASMIPEHFLLFGVVIALTLSGRRMPALQPSLVRLSAREILALTLSALLFAMIHTGNLHPLETAASAPLGILFAYMTLKSGSIWPALLVHWLLNLVPLSWDLATGQFSG